MKTTPVFNRILKNRKNRIQILQGGTSSSKTYSILQYLYFIGLNSTEKLVISIVAETMPHIKKGALRDFLQIISDRLYLYEYNKTEGTIKINNTLFEFFALDQPHKARGARRDILYINECNNVNYELYVQLAMRTKRNIFLDFNPSSRFWAHDLVDKESTSFDVSTYRDNPYLSQDIIKSIEALKDINPEWWRVYGEGQIGQLEGLIVPDFTLVDEMPDIETDCGLDFGFTNDPSCLLEVGMAKEGVYINELLYERYLTNQDLCAKMRAIGVTPSQYIVADSAEPKSIEEIRRQGFNIIKAVKGEDSFKFGVDKLRCQKIFVTKNSPNVIKDLRNAMWDKDRDGNFINKAKKGFLHSIDAIRYGMNRFIDPPQLARYGWI